MPVTLASSVPQGLVQPLIPLQNKFNLKLKNRGPTPPDWSEEMHGGSFQGFWLGWFAAELGGWLFWLPGLSSVYHRFDGVLLRALKGG